MAKLSLQEKRDKLMRRMDYLCSNQSIDDEAFFLFMPLATTALAVVLVIFVVVAYMLWAVCGYDQIVSLKISGCLGFMIGILAEMLARERAYKKATETIIARRKKVATALDRVNYKIRKQHDLEFVSLDPD